MILRPSPGRLRAVMHAAGKARSRPRPSSVITPHVRSYSAQSTFKPSIQGASKRGFHSGTASTRAVRSTTLIALLRQVLTQATRAVRIAPQQWSRHTLLSVLQIACYKVQSPLLKGAIDAFRSTAQRTSARTTTKAYFQLNRASVSFARGTPSGIGARPAAGQLCVSPLRGGVGLQTARKFSSGGARVFDNLIVNAPLALRLTSDEVQEKAKLVKKQPVSTRRTLTATGARRTGSTFSASKLPHTALLFATRHTEQESAASSCKSAPESEAGDFDLYFQFPQLTLPAASTAECVVTIRLIDPLYDALGGRHPTEPAVPRLFDRAFLLDAQTALEYEHRRYLRAKTVLRVLWDAGIVEEMDVTDDAVWAVKVRGLAAEEVRKRVRDEVGFAFDSWCRFERVGREEEEGGLDLSFVEEDELLSQDVEYEVSTPELTSLRLTSGDEVSVGEGDLISLPESDASSSSVLFDSRTSF
ncbi:uncharacterized protein SPSC_05743 [Sporisorium scitamineum]|uniref:Uncharacterized protein n=1 Tax=Sporisorium scitamineum TaxID=49012 RepID=A0A0F7SCT2_9BASI|nr:uncharacterized protein SPSC_05743 [Sporisorium scitamineum]CDW99479.1 hypothetical protein [Sporisorium scitamineum]